MLNKLIADLKRLGIKTVYGQWGQGKAPALPYIVIMEDYREDTFADDAHFIKGFNYNLELYFEKKDPINEQKIESFLDAKNYSYSIGDDISIESEKFYEKVYSINEIGE